MNATLESEHRACRKNAGLFDLSHFGFLEVSGKDACDWLHRILVSDIKKLKSGQGCHTAFLSQQGKIRGDAALFVWNEKITLFCDPLLTEKLPQEMLRYKISEKAELLDESARYGKLLLQGPKAIEMLRRWDGVQAPEEIWTGIECRAAGFPILLQRLNDNLSDPRFLIICPQDATAKISGSLMEAAGADALTVFGMDAYESLRIEGGIPRYGIDFNDETLLPEAGLGDLASATKGCYIGQEFVVRIRDRGQIHRQLKKFFLDTAQPVPPATPIFSGSAEAGLITSSARLPGSDRCAALGYLKREFWPAQTVLDVRVGEQKVAATVAP